MPQLRPMFKRNRTASPKIQRKTGPIRKINRAHQAGGKRTSPRWRKCINRCSGKRPCLPVTPLPVSRGPAVIRSAVPDFDRSHSAINSDSGQSYIAPAADRAPGESRGSAPGPKRKTGPKLQAPETPGWLRHIFQPRSSHLLQANRVKLMDAFLRTCDDQPGKRLAGRSW